MKILAFVLIGGVALLHIYFMILEMFLWTGRAKKVFRSKVPDFHKITKSMAANQGLYNGFLAAGLIWSIFIKDVAWSFNVALFFLSCVIIAGMYGAYSVSKKIFFVQSVPALLAIGVLLLARI